MTTLGNAALDASPPETNTARRLRARLGALFVSKNNQLSEPQIEFDEPWRTYTKGDVVKGKVVLYVLKPLGITHLTISLFGYVEVFKHHSRSQPALRTNPGRVASGKGKRWVAEYYGDGFASLFEHESTLCGEGRLDPNIYHFRFEVPFPPNRDLPTSIKFERGIIAYGVAVTVTRPTTIAPTVTATAPVQYRQTIDVAKFRAPKPRVATVDVVSSHPRSNMVRRLTSTSTSIADERSASQMSNTSRPGALGPVQSPSVDESPASPVPSLPSTMSVSSVDHRDGAKSAEQPSSHSSQDTNTASQPGSGKRIVTATFELQKAGAMPGDLIPVQVQIQHAKKITSLAGVVVTLYRQARVDMHPHISETGAATTNKAKAREAYYPRSKSGIGGLSLSAAGSSQVWRKDLAQTVSPLYVDEPSMTAVIRTMIRIPEDVFPTMSNVPGNMIMFKYFVEVLIDVHGRWSGRPGIPDVRSTATQSAPPSILNDKPEESKSRGLAYDSGPFYYPPVTRNIVKFQCEVVVGNKDSSKSTGKHKEPAHNAALKSEEQPLSANNKTPASHSQENEHYEAPDYSYTEGYLPTHHDPRFYDPRYYSHAYDNSYYTTDQYPSYDPLRPENATPYPEIPPPPILSDDSQLSEKERLKRAEATLLPSQPPRAEGGQPSSQDLASAPFLPEETPSAPADLPSVLPSSQLHIPLTPRAANSTPNSRRREDTVFDTSLPDQPAPSYTDVTVSHSSATTSGASGPPTNDRQLDRQRWTRNQTSHVDENSSVIETEQLESPLSGRPADVSDGSVADREAFGQS